LTSPESRLARLEERSDAVRREIDRISRQVDAFGPVAGQVIEVLAELRSMAEDFDEMRSDVREDRKQRIGMSTTLKVTLISASAVIVAAIIAAVAHQ
jgi:chromosome segregation ATPase